MIRPLMLGTLLVSLPLLSVQAEEKSDKPLVVDLIFPKKSTSRMKAPKPKLPVHEVSGQLTVDVRPVPTKAAKDRYLVQYFVGDELIHETTGYSEDRPERLSFVYTLDTTQFDDGLHKLIVNYWDKSGPSAIGILKIKVINRTEADR